LSFIRLAASPEALHQVRIDQGAADALIGCDLVVSSSARASGTYRKGIRAVVNTAEMPTGDVVRSRDADLARSACLNAITRVVGADSLRTINANTLAEALLGDAVYANMLLLGFAWQSGLTCRRAGRDVRFWLKGRHHVCHGRGPLRADFVEKGGACAG
jgi:indolepyruvate ferredoxin oxidoreductase